ncbi:MAG: ATP-binding cassette domain-containing protein, partial [Lactobacillus crispatus]|nr:ATP-binding cassette domain-containing protein [Lactobacillus crispatus]
LGDLHVTRVMSNKISTLSGGELICYKLAQILLGDYNFLVLDEPTNFLDINSIKALELFVKKYPFALILVSHDQSFVNNLNFKTLKIQNNQLINEFYVRDEQPKFNNDLQLMKFRLSQLIQDEDVSINEIKALKRKIEELEG